MSRTNRMSPERAEREIRVERTADGGTAYVEQPMTAHDAHMARIPVTPMQQDPTVTLATTIVNGIVGGLAQVIANTRMQSARLCAFCLRDMHGWEREHRDVIEQAQQKLVADRAMWAAQQPMGEPPTEPAPSQDIRDYLPRELLESAPQIGFAVTDVQGTACCQLHVVADGSAGVPRQPLLLGTAAMASNLSMLRQAGGGR